MKQKLKSGFSFVLKMFAAFAILVLAAASFQNCGTAGAPNQLHDLANQPSMCTDVTCAETVEEIQMEISNADPITVQYKLEKQIDISGVCNKAGYAGTRFYYSIEDNTGATTTPTTNAQASCDNVGRFHFQVNLTNNFNPALGHLVNVTMKAISADGIEVDSPLGTNTGSRRIFVIDN